MPTPAVPTSTIRAWALSQGLDVAERGRLKPEVLDAYNAAHRRTKAKATAAKPVPAAKPKPTAEAPKQAAARPVVATAPAPDEIPDAAEATQDLRLTDLEATVAALTARVAKLEANAAAAPQTKKRFGRKG